MSIISYAFLCRLRRIFLLALVLLLPVQYAAAQTVDLALTKTVDNPTPDVGEVVSFTLTLFNHGPDKAKDIEVRDLLPPGLTFVGASLGLGGYDPITGIWHVWDIKKDRSMSLIIEARVDTDNQVTNTATIISTAQPDPNSSNDTDSATVTPFSGADLALTKTVDNATPLLGAVITYTLAVTHQDGQDVLGVRVTDALPDGVSYVAHSGGDYDPATGTWRAGALSEGQTAMLDITAKVEAAGEVVNTAFIAYSNLPDPDPANNQDAASITGGAADLALTKQLIAASSDGTGTTGTFVITVGNDGPSMATGIEVTEALPDGMRLVAANASQGTFDLTTAVWDVGTLALGASATLTVTVEAEAGRALLNVAEITASDLPDPDSEPADGIGDDAGAALLGTSLRASGPAGGGSALGSARLVADLSLLMSIDNPDPATGSNIIYTILVTNSGPQSTAKVAVTDRLPDCLAFVAAVPMRGTYDAETGIWTIGELKVGETLTLAITATVTDACGGAVANTAAITSSSLPDPDMLFTLFDEPPVPDETATVTFTATTAPARSLEATPRLATASLSASETPRVVLEAAYPNPFNPATVIPFELAEAMAVTVEVYNLLGRRVATLAQGRMPAGRHTVTFRADGLPTGVYLVRLEAAGTARIQRITLMK